MQGLPELTLQRPAALAEALQLVAAQPRARFLAGGTDLVPNLRRGLGDPPLLIDLGALPGFATIEHGTGGVRLGAGVTLAQLAQHEAIARAHPAIAEAAAAVAGPAHRSVATVGGNLCQDTRCVFYNQSEWWRSANQYCLKHGGETCHVAPQGKRCHAAFSGDLAPALLALDAQVELVDARGTRRLALAELYRDDGAAHLQLAPGELLQWVHVPPAVPASVSGYRKARVRGAMDFPLAGVACQLTLHDGSLASLRVALTGTNARPFVLGGTHELLGKPVDDASMTQLGKLVQKQVSPMRSTAMSSNYRRLVAAALAQRLVRELAQLAQRAPRP
jgi:4-hydroxybenzoyl-CoA reductase subunit beta